MSQRPSLSIKMATLNRWAKVLPTQVRGTGADRVHAVADHSVFMLSDLRLSVSICVLFKKRHPYGNETA
jgi:hypothetical protein